MAFTVSVERIEKWVAHVAELPGCFSAHANREVAIAGVPPAVGMHVRWCERHGIPTDAPADGLPTVVEMIDAWPSEHGYEVNAFFAADRPPVRAEELPRYRALLAANRADLLDALDGLARPALAAGAEIGDVVGHVGGAENWYLEAVGLGLPRDGFPEAPLDAIAAARAALLDRLDALVAFGGIAVRHYEVWTARKVLRRALWHERDHIGHVREIRARGGGA